MNANESNQLKDTFRLSAADLLNTYDTPRYSKSVAESRFVEIKRGICSATSIFPRLYATAVPLNSTVT